ncbi:MAG: hypothetical protein O3C10_06950 [Chloroflexi bacterium]|nr:hypothetical protein [Chloroflexota bacterium]
MASERVQRRIDRLLDQAEEAADQYNWQLVLQLTAGILEADPENEDGLTFRKMAEASLREPGSISEPTSPAVGAPAAGAVPLVWGAASSSDTPAAFANGRYSVSKFLGEGGNKARLPGT